METRWLSVPISPVQTVFMMLLCPCPAFPPATNKPPQIRYRLIPWSLVLTQWFQPPPTSDQHWFMSMIVPIWYSNVGWHRGCIQPWCWGVLTQTFYLYWPKLCTGLYYGVCLTNMMTTPGATIATPIRHLVVKPQVDCDQWTMKNQPSWPWCWGHQSGEWLYSKWEKSG